MSKLAKLSDEISKTTRPNERNRLPDETNDNTRRNLRKFKMEETTEPKETKSPKCVRETRYR